MNKFLEILFNAVCFAAAAAAFGMMFWSLFFAEV